MSCLRCEGSGMVLYPCGGHGPNQVCTSPWRAKCPECGGSGDSLEAVAKQLAEALDKTADSIADALDVNDIHRLRNHALMDQVFAALAAYRAMMEGT